jgi:hypothetical protein
VAARRYTLTIRVSGSRFLLETRTVSAESADKPVRWAQNWLRTARLSKVDGARWDQFTVQTKHAGTGLLTLVASGTHDAIRWAKR